MAKLIDITGKAIAGEWGTDDELGTGIPVLRTTNFTNNGVVNYSNVVTRNITKKNIDEKYLRKGDIILEKSGGSDKQPVGRVIYFEGEENTYLFNNFTGLLRVKDQNKWFPRYVFYSLYANYRRGGTREHENKTTGLHNLKTDNYVSQYEVSDVDYNTQVEISEKLDRITKIISLNEQELARLEELTKARFVEMFGDPISNSKGWKQTTLNEVTDVRDGTHDSPKYYDVGYPLVTSKNLVNGSIDFSTCSLISESDYLRINERSNVDDGDILMPMIGTIGGAIVVKKDRNFSIKNVALIKFNKDCEVVNRQFILSLLNSDYMNDYFQQKKKGGTQQFIALGLIRNIPVILPSIEMQNEFASFVKQIGKSKIAVQKALDEAQVLFDSLMQQYFG